MDSPASLELAVQHKSSRPVALPALSRSLFLPEHLRSPSPRAEDRGGHRDLFRCLPEELVVYLFRFLGCEDLCKASLVCRQWRRVIRRNSLVQQSYTYQAEMLQFRLRADKHPVPVRQYIMGPDRPDWDLRPSMRAILSDWMIDVAVEFWFYDDTLHLGVRLLDAMMSSPAAKKIGKNDFQVLGTTCMLIAAKLYDATRPQFHRNDRYAWVTNGACNAHDIRRMESMVLNTLNFRVRLPTLADFLPAFIDAYDAQHPVELPGGGCDAVRSRDFAVGALARYLGDVSLTSCDCLEFRPSALAAAALTVAAAYFARPLPGPEIVVGYSLSELLPATRCLVAAFRWSKEELPRWNVPSGHRGVFYKYWEPSKPLRQSMHRQHIHRTVAELLDQRAPEAPPPSGALAAQQALQGRAAWEHAMAAHHSLCRCWEGALAGGAGEAGAGGSGEGLGGAAPAPGGALLGWEEGAGGAAGVWEGAGAGAGAGGTHHGP